jgi:hypothetical protein
LATIVGARDFFPVEPALAARRDVLKLRRMQDAMDGTWFPVEFTPEP